MRHRQVERRPGLAQLGRGEVDGDPPRREDEPGVADRPADAFAGLLDRRVGEADDREAGQPGRDVHLDPDEPAVEAVQRGGWDDSQHDATASGARSPALIRGSPAAHRQGVSLARRPSRRQRAYRRPARSAAATHRAASRPS